MTDIKEYIQRNASAFDSAELPEGHEGRFEAKLDALLSGAESSGREERKRRKTRMGIFSVLTTAAAATVAAVIFIDRPAEGEVDWFAGVADDPVAVYMAYSEKIAVMYEEIFTKDLDERWETTVGSITNENVAMIDQLPDELDDKTKAHILKEYYGELLNGLDKINKIKEL